MMYWLQQLQMRRWEFCNTQSRFPVGSSQLVNEPLAGRTSRCCTSAFLLLSAKDGDEWCSSSGSFGQAFKCRCQLSVLVQCLMLLPYYVWKWVSCILIHSICLEIFRCLVMILIFLTHVKCAHLMYHSHKASEILSKYRFFQQWA